MEDYIQNLKVKVEEFPNHDLISSCVSSLKSEDGIHKVKFESQTFFITFNPYVISNEEITHEIIEFGIKLSTTQKKGKGFTKWLSGLANQNKKILGSQRLDCCDLNH